VRGTTAGRRRACTSVLGHVKLRTSFYRRTEWPVRPAGDRPGSGGGLTASTAGEEEEGTDLRVLGVDPGTIRCGWGLVECDGPRLRHLDSGVIEAGRGDISARLQHVYGSLLSVMTGYQPDSFSLERNFVSRNVQSAFRLGEARGVAMAAAAAAGIPVTEYTPMMIKKSVVGYGRADKVQVQTAVQRLLGLGALPATDAADALAAAICHGLTGSVQIRVAEAVSLRGVTRGRSRSWRSIRG